MAGPEHPPPGLPDASVVRASVVRRWLLALGLAGVLYLPFAAKPVQVDDANFLMLAEGAARDPWRPHRHLINWEGIVEPAFDILSNPPGIAWYLAPVRNAPEWVLHLWMLAWLLPAAWGCRQLGRAYCAGEGFRPALFLLTSPVIVLSTHSLTPDLPLFACIVAGMGGFVTTSRHHAAFAILAGCSALFRYSGITMLPLLAVIGWRRGGWQRALTGLLSAAPILLLFLHDFAAYGEIHFLSVYEWQNDPEKKSLARMFGNLAAGVAMLGAAAVLPVLVWSKAAVAGALLGAGAGVNVAYFYDLPMIAALPTILALAAGGAALALALSPRIWYLDLSLWALGGTAFFLTVRFAAARYWAAFLPGVALLAFRNAESRPRWIAAGITANVVLSLALAIDDQNHARAQQTAARRVAAHGVGTFSGHWGWQHYLEQAGWTAIEQHGSPGDWHARSQDASQQTPDPAVCLELVERFEIADDWPGPRLYAPFGRSNYHSSGLDRFVPWTFSNEPYDQITVYRRCRTDSSR